MLSTTNNTFTKFINTSYGFNKSINNLCTWKMGISLLLSGVGGALTRVEYIDWGKKGHGLVGLSMIIWVWNINDHHLDRVQWLI